MFFLELEGLNLVQMMTLISCVLNEIVCPHGGITHSRSTVIRLGAAWLSTVIKSPVVAVRILFTSADVIQCHTFITAVKF